MKKVLFLTSLLLSFSLSFSTSMPRPTEFCFNRAGLKYGINPLLLYSIAKVESDLNPYNVGWNKNGTYDIGLMQINSSWLDELRRYGISKDSLFNPCQNVYVGAWILRQCMDRYGEDSWKSIDCYNKGYKAHESSGYVWKVYRTYERLQTRLLGYNMQGYHDQQVYHDLQANNTTGLFTFR